MSGETIDRKYLQLIEKLAYEGKHFDGRNGGTQAIIDRPLSIAWDMNNDAFPILAVRKQNFLHYLNEYLWEINGDDKVENLNNVYAPVDSRFLWNSWANKDDGHIFYSYGASWRKNGEIASGYSVDQLQMLELMIKENPMSRRLTLITQDVSKNAFINGAADRVEELGYPPQVPPCHPASYFTSDGDYLNLHVTSRSQDIVCGLPGDMIRYHLMAVCLAKLANLIPGKIWISFTNLHYYKEHEKKLFKTIDEFEFNSENYPKLHLSKRSSQHDSLNNFSYVDFELDGYVPSKFKSFPLIV